MSEAISGDYSEDQVVAPEPAEAAPENRGGYRGSSNIYTLPSSIASAHDRAQAHALGKINRDVHDNNRVMRAHIYPIMHELSALLREGEDGIHDLVEALSHLNLDEIAELYRAYRKEFMDATSDGSINDGAAHDLFPEDLREVSPHQLKKIEGKIKEWLDHCKNVNNQKTQDLYLMIQIGVALLTAFQNMQKEMSQSGNYMVRNQRT
ncbi:hypothetical protein [Simkania sp.]|uniref:hypothetical protein n=1 Tax=Simkania sp. TaxID=34094 RepID=UPI003B51890D